MRKVSLDKLDGFFAAVASTKTLYLPVDTNVGAKFEKWEQGKVLSDALNTVRSAKDFFFPQTENLMDFKTEGKKIEIIDTRRECEDFVIFGVRACDVRSISRCTCSTASSSKILTNFTASIRQERKSAAARR